MANIRSVAKRAGVSVATVSRYLNNPSKVKLETQEKIRRVIEEENYHANGLISSFFKNKTDMFGLIVQDINNPFFPEITDVISTEAFKNKYSVLLCNAQGKKEVEEMHIKKLMELRVDGLIVFNTVDEKLYEKVNVPIISVESPIKGAVHIEFNNHQGGQLVASKLSGCKKVLVLDGPHSLKAVVDRVESFNKHSVTDYTVLDYSLYEDTVFEEVDINDYDGIFGWNDLAVYKYIKYTQTKKRRNNQIIIGYDNIDVNKYLPHSFYTIDQSLDDISKTIVEALINYIETKNKPEDVVIDVCLVKKD